MMSGLKVNFHKRKVYGVGVGEWFLDVALTFLSCGRDRFLYLVGGASLTG